MEERLEYMTNEQLWAVVEMLRTIVEMSPDIPTALKQIDKVISNSKSSMARKSKEPA